MTRIEQDTPDAMREKIAYGDHPEQHFFLSGPAPSAEASLGTVMVLHGGYWRGSFTSTLMDPIAQDLTALGWAVANTEYRRVDAGGGWPLPFIDTRSACRELADRVRDGRLPGPLLILGHSVGGQLALLSARDCGADAVAGVLALAPVTDVLATLREGLGDDAAVGLLADVEGDRESTARDASPLFSLPIGVPMGIIHGLDDARVPHAHSLRFRNAAFATGDRLRLTSFEKLEHRAAIDPTGEHWATVTAELRRLADGGR